LRSSCAAISGVSKAIRLRGRGHPRNEWPWEFLPYRRGHT
jgi:hypothetical protein